MKRMLATTPRSWLSATIVLSLLVTTVACSSTDNGTATAAPQSASVSAVGESSADSDPVEESAEEATGESADEPTEAPAEESGSESGDSGSGDSGSGDSGSSDSGDTSGICGLVSVDEINAAVGTGDFDTASDVSTEPGQACVFTNATQIHGVTISLDSLDDYLGGDLAGDTDADSLANWASAQEIFVSDAVTTPITVGGIDAAQVTGKSSILDTPVGYAGLILDGKIISVTADGATLSEDPAELGGFAAAVLEVALAKLG